MARLRRQQQRVLTDSLESEYFELCVSSAYLKSILQSKACTKPLDRSDTEKIYQQATEYSLESLQAHIPSERSQELKTQALNGKLNLPQAHYLSSMSLEDTMGTHMAITIGSRRESLSFSSDRRKNALSWSTHCVKDIFSELSLDSFATIMLCNAAQENGNDHGLASRLDLSADQKKKIIRLIQPEAQNDTARLLAAKRATELLLSDTWLSLPKTDAFMEQVRDTATSDQMNKLISWSIQNESQISTLKLGSAGSSSNPSSRTSSPSNIMSN